MITELKRIGISTLLAMVANFSLSAASVAQLKVMSYNIWVSGSRD